MQMRPANSVTLLKTGQIGCPAIMNNIPAIARNNINRFYRRLTPLSLQKFESITPCSQWLNLRNLGRYS